MSYKSVRSTGIPALLLVIVSFVIAGSGNSQDRNQAGCLIFLYDSQACQCVRDRNTEFAVLIEKQIRNTIIDTSFIRYQRFDYSAEPRTVDSLLANLHERFLPVLILKSCDNILLYESSFMIDSVRFRQGLSDFTMVHNKEQHLD